MWPPDTSLVPSVESCHSRFRAGSAAKKESKKMTHRTQLVEMYGDLSNVDPQLVVALEKKSMLRTWVTRKAAALSVVVPSFSPCSLDLAGMLFCAECLWTVLYSDNYAKPFMRALPLHELRLQIQTRIMTYTNDVHRYLAMVSSDDIYR
ncbi:hypothetical protein I7I51_08872 [Histoplasma capsulatum]|uniref:Uncharacterized protein n=1 Tax=Ajellomyces capsulatus TaxID=5037 RepID=A0A8A1M5G6_AJECA|nr:hypothetical protein I7I51_08872 [Histoplasma capsulatum]